MKVSKGTIVRTVLLGIVVVNMFLKANGKPAINVSENEVASFVEYVIEIAVIVANWWYNNSFTDKAKKAQQYLEKLKEEEEE